jgi:hypothetical protein
VLDLFLIHYHFHLLLGEFPKDYHLFVENHLTYDTLYSVFI